MVFFFPKPGHHPEKKVSFGQTKEPPGFAFKKLYFKFLGFYRRIKKIYLMFWKITQFLNFLQESLTIYQNFIYPGMEYPKEKSPSWRTKKPFNYYVVNNA
nr:hypothetical protein [Thermosulfurimonas marina]